MRNNTWIRNLPIALVLVLALSGWSQALAQFGQKIKKPDVDVELASSVTAAVPGESFELAIRFQIEDGWHIYWINSGDAGMPPRVNWTTPDGFNIGDLVFPTPKRYVDKVGLTTNIHKDEVFLTAPVHVQPTYSASEAKVDGKLRYLVCKEQCILGEKDLSLTLPVAKKSEPAAKELFDRAHRDQPGKTSKYISVTPRVPNPAFKQGGRFNLVLQVDVTKGHHIQSNKPSMESFVATDVFLAPIEGVTTKAPKYPKPKMREVQYLGKLSEFEGKFEITIPMEVDEAPESGSFDISGIITYQVCTDGGQCYPPDAISFKHAVKSAEAETDDLLKRAKRLADMGDDIPWQPWSPGLPEQLALDGHIVYVEVWADWCPPCKTNREMLRNHEVRKLFDQLCVVPISADYTDYGDEIRAFFEKFNRKGPPMAMVYEPGKPNEPILLPVKLAGRPETLSEAIRSAGASQDCTNAIDDDDAAGGTGDTGMAPVEEQVDYDSLSSAADAGGTAARDLVDEAGDVGDSVENAAIASRETGTVSRGDDDDEADAVASGAAGDGTGPGGIAGAGEGSTASSGEETATAGGAVGMSFAELLPWLGFALVGGLILNIMPCVLPVISIKILSFVQQAGESPRRVFLLGLSFSAGIVLSFLALATAIVVLKDVLQVQGLGWGFQFQSPTVVIIMTSIIFAFGLSLFGVFEVTLPGAAIQQISAAETKEGLLGAFMKGVLATVLATPCTAPFLGSALGVAFSPSATPAVLFFIFAAAGVGMAFPYVLLTWQPAWLKFMPKPGAWMERFKQFMGFILMGTVVWLAWPLKDLIGAEGLVFVMAFLTCVGLAVWILGLQTPLTPLPKRLGAWVMALGIVVGGWFVNFGYAAPLDGLMEHSAKVSDGLACVDEKESQAKLAASSPEPDERMIVSEAQVAEGLDCLASHSDHDYRAQLEDFLGNMQKVAEGLECLESHGGGTRPKKPYHAYVPDDAWNESIPWKKWSKGLPEQLAADGHTVFVDFTATWCATCIANKKATVDTPEVRKLMSELCVIPMKADFTRRDPDIVKVLQQFQRGGVPLNVIYPAGRPGEPITLPEQLIGRQSLVLSKLQEAGSGDSCAADVPQGVGAALP